VATRLELVDPERVAVLDGGVHIDGFIETDPDVFRVLASAENPEEVTHGLLRLGALSSLVAQTDMETQIVERRFEGMARTFDVSLETAVSKFSLMSDGLLDEEAGALPQLLGELKTGISSILDDTFDEDSKSSAIAKIDVVLEGAMQRFDRVIRANFDPDAPDSALAKTRNEIVEVVKDQTRDLRNDVKDLAVAVATSKVRAEAVEQMAIKGFSYEELLEHGLATIAVVHGDVTERVGTRTGATGSKHGDHVVSLSAEDTCGLDARFVIECKDRSLTMPKTLVELDKALENHGALAAIAAFSRQEHAPTPLPFMWSGKRAILVYDKDDPDDGALQLAYAWARWICRRDLTGGDKSLDAGRIEAALTCARQALQRQQAARSCFTAAAKKISEGSGHVDNLVDEVRASLAELWDALIVADAA
jgi:hypothetical protein